MRYSPEHKQQARAKLVEAGAALAKKQGFSNTGMDALMAASGMTTGAFYSQFRSKPELLRAIVEHELERTVERFTHKSPEELLRVIGMYLSPQHVAYPEAGCPIPSLGAEIGRADELTRQCFEDNLLRVHQAATAVLKDEAAAWALVCQTIGAVLIARAMATDQSRQQVLKGVMTHTRDMFEAL